MLTAHYIEHASILQDLSLFQKAITIFTRSIKRLNANCNAAHLSEYLFKNECSYMYTKSCSCGTTESREIVTCNVNVDILLQQSLHQMQCAIDDMKNIKAKCRTCNVMSKCDVTYGKHIIIDTSIFIDYKYISNKSVAKHDLNSIAKIITLNDTNYILAGIVHYIKGGHYVAFAYVRTYWYEYDDMKKKCTVANPMQQINPHVILYVKHNTNL